MQNELEHLRQKAVEIEDRLRQSEERFGKIFHASSNPMAITTVKEGLIVDINAAYTRFTGYGREELVGRTTIEHGIWKDPRQRDEVVRLLQKDGKVHNLEVGVLTKSGGIRTVLFSVDQITLNLKPHLLSTSIDITDRKIAEERVKESEEKFRQLANEQRAVLNTINMGLCYLRDRKVQWINPAMANMFGYEICEVQGLDTSIYYHDPEDYQRVDAEGLAHLASGSLYSTEALMKRKDGSILWGSITGQAINPENPEEGSIWVVQDITERRQAEEALRASQERFQRLVQNSNDIITTTDERGVQTSISGPLEKLFGYKPEELIGMNGFDLMHPDDREYAYRTFAEAMLQPGAVRRVEYRFRHKNGNWVPVETVGTNLLHDPAVKSVVLNIREMSDRKRLQAYLQQAAKMEAIGVLAAGVAHDFNNLLNVINGYCELLLDDLPVDDPNRNDLHQIRKAGQSAAALTSQLLAFSRKQIIQPEILNLNDVIEDMRRMIPRLIGESIEFMAISKPDLWLISADPGQIHQIIMNLAVNARDAMPNGGNLTLEVANFILEEDHFGKNPEVAPGQYAMLAVSDTGIGMDEETQSHIFEPFFTTKGRGRGTGLGLSTIYGIVKQNNGYIWVYSEPGKGTTFKIYFPRVIGEISKAAINDVSKDHFKGYETVLVAEDEESVRALISRILHEQGYTVLIASGGHEALNVARGYQGEVHLILTDVVMPGMSGKDLASQLKESRPGIKSLFMSGYTDDAIVHHGILDSGIVFLQKPFSVENLARKVREVLDSD